MSSIRKGVRLRGGIDLGRSGRVVFYELGGSGFSSAGPRSISHLAILKM
jgi:hypothetical protein